MLKKIFTISLLFFSTTVWAESDFSLTTGFDFTTGKYGGDTSTNILYIPVTGKYQIDNMFFKVTVPYIRVSSAGGVVRNIGRYKIKTGTATETQSGLGDVTASAGYTVLDTEKLALDLVGNIKFGTADANKNLGTGENDYSAQVDGYYFIDKTTLLATVGYKIIGAPAGVTTNNIVYGAAGFSQKTGETSSAGIMLDAAQASSDVSPGTRELTFFVSSKLTKTEKLQFRLLRGLSDSSPDLGISVMVTGSF